MTIVGALRKNVTLARIPHQKKERHKIWGWAAPIFSGAFFFIATLGANFRASNRQRSAISYGILSHTTGAQLDKFFAGFFRTRSIIVDVVLTDSFCPSAPVYCLPNADAVQELVAGLPIFLPIVFCMSARSRYPGETWRGRQSCDVHPCRLLCVSAESSTSWDSFSWGLHWCLQTIHHTMKGFLRKAVASTTSPSVSYEAHRQKEYCS